MPLSTNMHLMKVLLNTSLTRRVTIGHIGDSKITNNGYGNARAVGDAAFPTYGTWASGFMNGNFGGSLDPFWQSVTSNGANISEGNATDEANSGILSAANELNGAAWSVPNGATEGDSGNNLLNSGRWDQNPDYIGPWSDIDFHFHYTYSTGSDADEALQLQVKRGVVRLTGTNHSSTSGSSAYGLIAGDAGDVSNGVTTQRIEVEVKGATGLVAVNNLCVEYANRLTGIQTTILNQESGGTADDWKTLTAANSTWLQEQCKRIGDIQNEDDAVMMVIIEYGSNEFGGGDAAGYKQDLLDGMSDLDDAWVAAGHSPSNLTYCLKGNHPRTDSNFGFRDKQVEIAAENPTRVCTYQPTDTWPTVASFPSAYYDGGSENAHLTGTESGGYYAVAADMLSVALASSAPATIRGRAGGSIRTRGR